VNGIVDSPLEGLDQGRRQWRSHSCKVVNLQPQISQSNQQNYVN